MMSKDSDHLLICFYVKGSHHALRTRWARSHPAFGVWLDRSRHTLRPGVSAPKETEIAIFGGCGRKGGRTQNENLYLLESSWQPGLSKEYWNQCRSREEAETRGKVVKAEEGFTIHLLIPERRINTHWTAAKRPHLSKSLYLSWSLSLVHRFSLSLSFL